MSSLLLSPQCWLPYKFFFSPKKEYIIEAKSHYYKLTQRVGHDWVTELNHFKVSFSRIKYIHSVVQLFYLSSSKIFSSPQRKTLFHTQSLSISYSLSPQQSPVCLCFYAFNYLGYINRIIYCVTFLWGSSMLCSMYFIYAWIVLRCMNISYFVYPVISWWVFGMFPPLGDGK